ncbi:Fic family protein [Variovorax sp. YR752]|uniref:Fic family protein n=2 Tax=unclassified Variovorax TaxID=663243 RepID=UPI000BE23CCE
MFHALAPSQCDCIIGRYRGDPSCPELQNLIVGVGSDPRVGVAPAEVESEIAAFESRCDALMKAYAYWLSTKGSAQSAGARARKFAKVLAPLAELFLRIHPYMDGNGHTARLLLYVLMSRAGFSSATWSVDGKKEYSEALSLFRDGKVGKLEEFFATVLLGGACA